MRLLRSSPGRTTCGGPGLGLPESGPGVPGTQPAPPLGVQPRSAALEQHPVSEPATNEASSRKKRGGGRCGRRKPACRCDRCNLCLLSPDVMPVSSFRIAVCSSLAGKSEDQSTNAKIITTTILQFTFHEYTPTDPTTRPQIPRLLAFQAVLFSPSPQEGSLYAQLSTRKRHRLVAQMWGRGGVRLNLLLSSHHTPPHPSSAF